MIDPLNVNDFNRTDEQLEEYLLFCIVVAGKTAKTQAKALDKFLFSYKPYILSPFEKIKWMIHEGILLHNLQESKLGQYNRLMKCFTALVNSDLNLRTCTTDDLEAIPGIGFKTSRFFIVYSRENPNYGILDTHILKFIKMIYVGSDEVPKSTPSSKQQYLKWEKVYLDFIAANGLNNVDFDLEVWTFFSTGGSKELLSS